MSGNIYFLPSYYVMTYDGRYILRGFLNLKEEDTYIMVFNHNQDKLLDTILKDNRLKILFKSKPAINKNYPERMITKQKGNTVVVFELK
jgi:hypothetical protein